MKRKNYYYLAIKCHFEQDGKYGETHLNLHSQQFPKYWELEEAAKAFLESKNKNYILSSIVILSILKLTKEQYLALQEVEKPKSVDESHHVTFTFNSSSK